MNTNANAEYYYPQPTISTNRSAEFVNVHSRIMPSAFGAAPWESHTRMQIDFNMGSTMGRTPGAYPSPPAYPAADPWAPVYYGTEHGYDDAEDAYSEYNPSSTASAPAPAKFLPVLVLALALKKKKAKKTETPAPEEGPNRQELLARILDNYDDLKAAGVDDKDSTFGLEDVDAILENPNDYDADLVALAKDIRKCDDVVDLADWVTNRSGAQTQDHSNTRLEYVGALNLLEDGNAVAAAIDYLRANFTRIAGNGGNSTAMERSDVEAEIQTLNNGTDTEKALAATLSKIYYEGPAGEAKGDLITALANATGNNNSSSQTITVEGIDRLRSILNKNGAPGSELNDYDYYGVGFSGYGVGDPHFKSLKDGRTYDIHPPQGSVVNLLGDKRIKINGALAAWGNSSATVFSQFGLQIGTHKIAIDRANPTPTIDGVAMTEGQTVQLQHGTVTWQNNKLTFNTVEYQGTLFHRGSYLDIHLNIGAEGNRADGVQSEGIIGVTANIDIAPTVNSQTGAGALGEGRTIADYTISSGDLFGEADNAAVRRFTP